MTTIEIFLNDSEFSSLAICINNCPVEYTVQNNKIIIEQDVPFGIHQLSIAIVLGNRVDISDVRIDNASLRMMLYLSYIEHNCQQLQPATVLWDKDQVWRLPFGNPVSFWQSLVHEKINNGEFGQNLFEKYYFYYPESMTIRDDFPTIIKSFFKHDFDFVCVPRDTLISQLPYCAVNLDIDAEKQTKALEEIKSQRVWIEQHKQPIAQTVYNSLEFNSGSEKEWCRLYLIQNGNTLITAEQFPALYDFVDSLGISDPKLLYIGILPNGGCIAPHADRVGPTQFDNDLHYYLYVPLLWDVGNYFKINGAGIIKDGKPCLINHMDYVHSLINASEQERIIIGIKIPTDKNSNLLQYVQSKI